MMNYHQIFSKKYLELIVFLPIFAKATNNLMIWKYSL